MKVFLRSGPVIGLAALLFCILAGAWQPARSEEGWLFIQPHDGPEQFVPLAEIARIDFAEDMLTIHDEMGEQSFPLASIRKLEFSFDPTSVGDGHDLAVLTKLKSLFPSQPNPCSSETRIAYELPRAGRAQVRVYGIDGRLVRVLRDGPQEEGRHSVLWDGTDATGRRVASGVYFYQLVAPGVSESRKLILLR